MNKAITYFYILLFLILVFAIGYGFLKSTPTKSSDDPSRPIVDVKEPTYDLGKLSVKETKEHDFKVSNIGKSDLTLKNFSTSCGCTYAKVYKDDKEISPKFSMHINSDWQTKLKPGESLTVKAVYDPSAMPVQGRVERFVTIATDDPNRPTVELKLSAEVFK